MEELTTLVKLVSELPQLTVWVLLGYLAYKLVQIGSIYGIIRLLILKAYDYKVRPQTFRVGTACINADAAEALNVQLARLSYGVYIHMAGIEKLKKAIDHMESQ